MEKDKVNQKRIVPTSTSEDEDLVSRSVEDSKKLNDFASQNQKEVSIAKEVDDSKIQEDSKDPTNRFDFNSVSASFNELEKSFEMVSKSSLSGSAANAGIKNLSKEMEASAKPETSKPASNLLDDSSAPSSNGVNRSGETTTESSSFPELPELPSFFKPKFKMSDFFRESTNASSNETSPQQSLCVEHGNVNLDESEIFVMEMSDEESSSTHEKTCIKSCKFPTRTRDGHADASAPVKREFLLDSTPKFAEPLQEEVFEPQNSLLLDIHRPLFCREDFSNAVWPAMMRNGSGFRISPDSGNTSGTSNDGTQEVPENPSRSDPLMNLEVPENPSRSDPLMNLEVPENPSRSDPLMNLEVPENPSQCDLLMNLEVPEIPSRTDHLINLEVPENPSHRDHLMNLGKNIAERVNEFVELKIGNFGPYYEVFHATIYDVHIAEVLKRMKNNHYLSSRNEEDLKIFGYCRYLFEKGIRIKVVNNEQGTLCENHPARIFIPYENYLPGLEPKILEELSIQHSGATCRDGFIAPTIVFQRYLDGVPQFICRCAILAEESAECKTMKEVKEDPGSFARELKHIKAIFVMNICILFVVKTGLWINSEFISDGTSKTAQIMLDLKEYQEEGKKYKEFGKILQIPDLMAGDTKRKLWISLNPTENIYEDFDTDFDILKLPFPDIEFFRRYHESGRKVDGMLWDGSEMGSDVVTITQNYIETIFTHFMREKKSIVINCVPNCDQESLFIALLRILLWADGKAHIALTPHEIVYLTLANDWYFSGHNLPDRLKHGEEIMHFCYNILEHLFDDKFSPITIRDSHKGPYASFRPEENKKHRVRKLQYVKQIFMRLYDEHILRNSE